MFCINCGSEISEDAAFCMKCGMATADSSEKPDISAAETILLDMPLHSEEDKAIAFAASTVEAFVETERGLSFMEELVIEVKEFKYGWVLGIVGIIISIVFVSSAELPAYSGISSYLIAFMGATPALLYWVYTFVKSARNAAASLWKAKIPLDKFEFSIGKSAFSHIIMTIVSIAIPTIYFVVSAIILILGKILLSFTT